MTQQLTIDQLNQMSATSFKQTLSDIFEHSAWIAEQACDRRPFDGLNDLHSAMVSVVEASPAEAKLALLRAHPQLAGREAQAGELTDASTSEQDTANLNALSSDEMATITQLNHAYLERFGFPFIIAVLGHNKDSIFSEFERRVHNDKDTELKTALEQVAKIARFRLKVLIQEQPQTKKNV